MRTAPLASLLLASCTLIPEVPEGQGQGLVAVDDDPAAETTLVQRPEWTTGDRFVFLRGGVVRQGFRVEVDEEEQRLIDEDTGLTLTKDRDFGDLRQEREGQPGSQVILSPVDIRYSWPLWVGKSWTCHFMRKAPGEAMPLLVTYDVEAEETLEVPAGTFRCFRILRSARPAADGSFYPRHTILWYAPEIGIEVRWIEQGLLTELAEYQRQ